MQLRGRTQNIVAIRPKNLGLRNAWETEIMPIGKTIWRLMFFVRASAVAASKLRGCSGEQQSRRRHEAATGEAGKEAEAAGGSVAGS